MTSLKHKGMAETLGTAIDPANVTFGTYGIIGQVKEELSMGQNRSLGHLNRLNAQVLSGKPPRPHTAGAYRDVRGVDLGLAIGAKTAGAEQDVSLGDSGNISGAGNGEDLVGDSNRIVVQSPVKPTALRRRRTVTLTSSTSLKREKGRVL